MESKAQPVGSGEEVAGGGSFNSLGFCATYADSKCQQVTHLFQKIKEDTRGLVAREFRLATASNVNPLIRRT
jgi:hypothetical protein